MNEKISALFTAVLEGDITGTKDGVQFALDGGLEPGTILAEGMSAA